MKTKLLFYAIQKFKNVTKISGIFTFLIIFFMTVSSYSQSDGISFNCGGYIFSFGAPVENELFNGYPYWTGGTDNSGLQPGAPGYVPEYLLFNQKVGIKDENNEPTGDFVDRWEVHSVAPDPNIEFPNDPNDPTVGSLYFFSDDLNGVSPVCNIPEGVDPAPEWLPGPGIPCPIITVTCTGGPITGDCFTYYTDTDEDGFGSVLDMEGEEFCSDPGVGYSLTNDDCNDEDASINPGAEEICDGQDNNCIGGVDEDIEDCTNGVIIDYCNDAKTKILVCHNGKDICVSINAMDAHMAHDDFIGSCTNARAGDIDISEEDPVSYDVVSWPNPSNNLFNVKMITPNSIDKIDLKTFDINGRLIHSNIINGNEDYQFGEQLSSGIYFVRLSQADITKVIKVIKR